MRVSSKKHYCLWSSDFGAVLQEPVSITGEMTLVKLRRADLMVLVEVWGPGDEQTREMHETLR